jgi:assimilatory nitrate reductase catalytic subunit
LPGWRADRRFSRPDAGAGRRRSLGHGAAEFCGLEVEQVAGFYRDFIAAPRAITLYTMGINQSASGSDVMPLLTSTWPAGNTGVRAAGRFR